MSKLGKEGRKQGFGRHGRWRWPLLLWPAIAVALTVLLWCFAYSRSNAVHLAAEKAVVSEAQAAADAYEQFITRSFAQMDQVSMQLKHSWEQAPGTLLEQMARDGMFLDEAFEAVSIVDRNGVVLSSTRSVELGKNHADDAFFQFHKNNNTSALLTGPPPGAQTPVHDKVLFSRRLDTPDDEFAGVVLIMAPSRYFTSFYLVSASGHRAMVATMGAATGLRLEEGVAPLSDSSLSAFPDDAGLWAQSAGVKLLAGRFGFRDGVARVLGWRRSPVYPIVALVALSHAAALAGAQTYWVDSRNNAMLATACLLLLAASAMAISHRLSLRRHEQDNAQLTYRTATESANDGFYMAAAVRNGKDQIIDFDIVDCNERGAQFYGMTRSALIGARLSELDTAVVGSTLFRTYTHAMTSGFYEDEREMPEGGRLTIRWGQRRLVRVGNGLAITLRDISERKAHAVALQRMANEDFLTGLPNRHWVMDFLPRALAQASAAGGTVVILLINLDGFKNVNDSHGPAAGDQVLVAAAQRIRSVLRPGDHVVRFGGDEFIVVLDGAASGTEGRTRTAQLAERIVSAFAELFQVGRDQHAVGISIGGSMFPRDASDAAALIKMSDIAMHAAKAGSKGRFQFFEPALSAALQARSQLKQKLVSALEKDQFVLYFQARADALSGALCSMEALIRWIHPDDGIVSPLEFIPFAEENDLIHRLGEVVMHKACAQLAAWRRAGLPLVPMSINVSPKQFTGASISGTLARFLQQYDIDAALIEVEITESAMLGDKAEVLAELSRLRELGVKLHIDDFGTGYSSLSQLQKLKMDVLKVDRSFTIALGQSREGAVFVQAIVSMAHALGMTVVAEGVETIAQLRILQQLGCDEVQGYLIARPMPASEFAALLGRRGSALLPAPGAPGELNSATGGR